MLTFNPCPFACFVNNVNAVLIGSSGGIVSTDDQLSKLVFCTALIKETLRLRSGSVVLFFHNAVSTCLDFTYIYTNYLVCDHKRRGIPSEGDLLFVSQRGDAMPF